MWTKLLISLLALLVVALTGVVLVTNGVILSGDDADAPEVRAVYDAYAAYMSATDKPVLTYEDWIRTLKGAKGDRGESGTDGLTPFIGANGNWWIGLTDTGVSATGAKGDPGEPGSDGGPGAPGAKGEDGRGIERVELIDGCLVIFYTDGTSEDLGRIGSAVTSAPTTTAAPNTTLPATTAAPITTVPVTTAAPVTAAPIRELPAAREIKRADGITVDGLMDPAYLSSATASTCYQAPGYADPTSGVAVVDPYEYIGMPTIASPGDLPPTETAVTLYALWGEEAGEPYLYLLLDVTDPTYHPRSTAYLAHPNPWINDSVELSYKLGGNAIPLLPQGQDTYPTYSNLFVDAREKAAADHGRGGIPNHTATDAQRSLYFDEIVSATRRTAGGYTVELKIPARSEAFEGYPGYDDFARTEGEALAAGDYIFLCLQLNDLAGVPEGYDTYAEYDAEIEHFGVSKYPNAYSLIPEGPWVDFENDAAAYMYCAGNRNATYLRTPGAGPAVFRLSGEWAD